MRVSAMSNRFQWLAAIAGVAVSIAIIGAASATPCLPEPQGEGRVAAVIDSRSFRLDDGREIRLAGIEPAFPGTSSAERMRSLATLLAGRKVRLHADDDTPDRYGRQIAFVWLVGDEKLAQQEILAEGEALVSPDVSDMECAGTLLAAETVAREAKRGIWADPTAIKNTESPGGILAGIGRFTLVEGKVLSVRQAGATTYLNFGRNWTRDFAVTIPRRALANLAAAGLEPKSLENKRIRVRGFVEARTGPRIEVLQAGQIELIGER